jgi:hypothetical protein
MVISISLFISLILFISFCLTSRKMHLFEIIFLWLVISLFIHNLSSVILMNLEFLTLSKEIKYFWTHLIKRILLFPLIIIWLFEMILRHNHFFNKLCLLLLCIFLLISGDYIAFFIGVYHQKNWNIGYSFIQWGFIVSISYLLWKGYRKILYKEEPS